MLKIYPKSKTYLSDNTKMSVSQSLDSASVKKLKFKVVYIKAERFGVQHLNFVFLSNDKDKIALILKKEVSFHLFECVSILLIQDFDTNATALQMNCVVLICRFALYDTIEGIPVFGLKPGKSIIKSSKLPLENCPEFGTDEILVVRTKLAHLVPKLLEGNPAFNLEYDFVDKPLLSLMEYLTLEPNKIKNNQIVEV